MASFAKIGSRTEPELVIERMFNAPRELVWRVRDEVDMGWAERARYRHDQASPRIPHCIECPDDLGGGRPARAVPTPLRTPRT